MAKRLFIALNLPSLIKETLGQIQEKLQKENKQTKLIWVNSQILHLTLSFLGEVDEEKEGKIKKILDQLPTVDRQPLTFTLDRLALLPHARQPRILCVNAKFPRQILTIKKYFDQELAALGLTVDHRPWQAHITLARNKNLGKINDLNKISLPQLSFSINSLDLMASQLTATGPIYNKIQICSLDKAVAKN